MRDNTPRSRSLVPIHLCLLLAGLLYQTLPTSAAIHPVLLGSWPGYPRGSTMDAAVSGPYAYLAMGQGGLRVIDLADPTDPVRVGSYVSTATSRPVQLVAVQDTFAYLAYPAGGLEVVDVSNPGDPKRVGGYAADWSWPKRLVVTPQHALVAVGGDGLAIFDITAPANPTLLSQHTTGGMTEDVAVSGHYAYLATGSAGLEVLDWSDPTAPQTVGRYSSGLVQAVALTGSIVWIITEANGLEGLDVSDPTNPQRRSVLPTGISAQHLVIEGTRAYASAGYGWEIFDLSDPDTPQHIAGYNTEQLITSIAVSDSSAFLTSDALHVFDISDPANALPLGRYSEGEGWGSQVGVDGPLAYLADARAGLQVIDVSAGPDLPQRGHHAPSSNALGLALAGDHVYVADSSAGLEVFDISNPSDPLRVGQLATIRSALGLAVSGNLAYLLDSDLLESPAAPRGYGGELRVMDVSDPVHPREIGVYNLEGSSQRVAVSGSHALVAVGWREFVNVQEDPPVSQAVYRGELQVIDISDPTNPRLVGRHEAPWWAADLAVAGSYVCLLTRSTQEDRSRLVILDLSDPTNPRPVGAYERPGWAAAVAVAGNYAFLGCQGNTADSLDILDLADPVHPRRIGGSNAFRSASGLVVVDHRLFVAAGDEGLVILELPPILNSFSGSNGELNLSWEGFGPIQLEKATQLSDPDWQDIDATENGNSLTLPASEGHGFFRLLRP